MSAMLRPYKEKDYHITVPLPFIVNGHATYISTMYDDAGVAWAYGLASVADNQIVATGSTLQDAYRSYVAKWEQKNPALGNDVAHQTITGKVARIASEVRQGNSLYIIQIEGNTHLFTGSTDLGESMAITRVGDTVDLGYFSTTDSGPIALMSFTNRSTNPVIEAQKRGAKRK